MRKRAARGNARVLVACLLAAIGVLSVAAVDSASAEYPDKPVKIIVPYGPGGATDTIGRLVADGLSKIWKQPVVVENKPGAGSNIGANFVAHQAPDGYTLLLATDPALMLNMWVYKDMPYDPAKDLDPVTHLLDIHSILVVSPSLGVRTLEDFVALMKKDGAKYNYGSPGVGDGSHIGMEWFKNLAGFQMTHIPYTGMGPSVQGMLSGDHQALIVSVVTAQQHIESGAMIPIAVSGKARAPMLPNVPTFAEQGYPTIFLGFSAGLMAPAGTPLAIRKKIADDARKAFEDPEFRKKFVDGFGYEVVSSSPEAFADFLTTAREEAKKKVELAGAAQK